MSYILDALRKADAQRERDPARGIHAQSMPGGSAGLDSGGGMRPWFWAATAAGLATLTAVSWYVYADKDVAGQSAAVRATPPAPAPVAAAVAVPAPVVGSEPTPVVAASPVAMPAPVATAIEPPPPPPLPPTPVTRSALSQTRDPRATSLPTMRGGPQPGAVAQAPGAMAPAMPSAPPGQMPGAVMPTPAASAVLPSMPGAASTQVPSPLAPSMNPQQPPASMAPAPQPAPPPPPPPINLPPPAPVPPPVLPPAPPTPPAAGLPADAPKIAISGGVYSTNPAQRMLIVNGQVFNEGSEIGPGVVLEEIRTRGSAVLRFRGARYTVRY